MWTISKDFDFCYGHRVHCQLLNNEFSNNALPKCRHLHGHNGKIQITLSSKKLNKQDMVVDFCNLNWFKKFIDDELDHKFIIDKNDPLIDILIPPYMGDKPRFLYKSLDPTIFPFKPTHEIIDPEWYAKLDREELKELYEGFVIVNFVPTSENLAKWFAEIIEDKMKEMKVTVESVKFCETPKTSSTYS